MLYVKCILLLRKNMFFIQVDVCSTNTVYANYFRCQSVSSRDATPFGYDLRIQAGDWIPQNFFDIGPT